MMAICRFDLSLLDSHDNWRYIFLPLIYLGSWKIVIDFSLAEDWAATISRL